MNTFVIIVVLVLGCVALDIVILLVTMQLMVRLDDLPVAEVVVLPSMQTQEDASSIIAANHHFFSYQLWA
jgi:hypothetical protein